MSTAERGADARLLVADLAATAPVWTLRPADAAAIRNAAPEGWRTHIVTAPTVSDGDGGTAPSAEAVEAIRDAEVYVGFGISRPDQAATVGRLADGVVVGSAVVRAADRDINAALSLVREMRTALDQLP